MATSRFEIKSHKKGNATRHSRYIKRQGDKAADDLVAFGCGNLPSFANNQPQTFWAAADRFERANGSAAREYLISLPKELSDEKNAELAWQITEFITRDRPFEFAFHRPRGKISGEDHPHVHISLSDRAPDGIERPPEQYFRRAHPTRPEAGGVRKLSGGKTPEQLAIQVKQIKAGVAALINAELARSGCTARVDYRSNQERGIAKMPERRLHPALIRNLSADELGCIRKGRKNHRT